MDTTSNSLGNLSMECMSITSQKSLPVDDVTLFSITGRDSLSSLPSKILLKGKGKDCCTRISN